MNNLANSLYQLYQQFLPIAKKCEIQLDLDLGKAANVQIEASDELMQEIGDELTSALTRSQDTHLSITASYNHIKLHDPDTVLSPAICQALTTDRVHVTSRVGFGTTITIDLHK